MASIRSPGLGSGLDVEALVAQLVAAEGRPVQARLDRQEAGLQARLTAFGALKGALSAFQSAMQSLSSIDKFRAVVARSADETVYTASAGSDAVGGNYAIEVHQLARRQTLATPVTFGDLTDAVGTGKLTFRFGTVEHDDDTGQVTGFAPNPGRSSHTITIDASNNSLQGLRDAINDAGIGVRAGIVHDGMGYRLTLTSADSGAANGFLVEVTDDDGDHSDASNLSRFRFDQSASQLDRKTAAIDASLTINGISITRASNTITGAIEGVTLNLLKPSQSGVTVDLTVARDAGVVKSAVGEFVKAYNDLDKVVKDLTAYDAEIKQAGVLQSDAAVRSAAYQIRRALGSPIDGLSGSYMLLGQIGMSFDKHGKLSLDSARLQNAMDAGFDVAGLFAERGHASDGLVNYAGATSETRSGKYALTVTQLATRGALSGVATAGLADSDRDGVFDNPFVIDAGNDTFSLKVDGINSGTITLSAGSYASVAALTSELQSKINADGKLKAAGVGVTVTFDQDNGRLVITSDRYGSASNVEMTGLDASTLVTLGLSGAGTAGVDVAGTINGAEASGSGRFLTAAVGDAKGLRLEILGGETGARGTVEQSRGYAYQLERLAGQLLEEDGSIDARTDGLNAGIEHINGQRETLARRLKALEERYRAQFSLLDGLVARMRSTSDFLTQQLAGLPGAWRRNQG